MMMMMMMMMMMIMVMVMVMIMMMMVMMIRQVVIDIALAMAMLSATPIATRACNTFPRAQCNIPALHSNGLCHIPRGRTVSFATPPVP